MNDGMKKKRKQRNRLVAAGGSISFAAIVILMFDAIAAHAGLALSQSIVVESANPTDAFPVAAQGKTTECGIVMGTSHHEPMMRSQKEWSSHRQQYGNGEWNYKTNAEGSRQFWQDGLERNKDYEQVITMAMRGDGVIWIAKAAL